LGASRKRELGNKVKKEGRYKKEEVEAQGELTQKCPYCFSYKSIFCQRGLFLFFSENPPFKESEKEGKSFKEKNSPKGLLPSPVSGGSHLLEPLGEAGTPSERRKRAGSENQGNFGKSNHPI